MAVPYLRRPLDGGKSNELYKKNLAKGQTGLSIAFDLPTQSGYDSDHPLARGEVGKVGVPISHLDDMHTLFDGIPLEQMNTSMTINATAMWLLVALHRRRRRDGVLARQAHRHHPERHHQGVPLARHLHFPARAVARLIKETFVYSAENVPKWNPTNICSYHLQEAGATPVQELAFALATAIAVLDTVKAAGEVRRGVRQCRRPHLVLRQRRHALHRRECARCARSASCGTRSCRDRYGVTDRKQRMFRYGVQVNSLGLTEPQAENNA